MSEKKPLISIELITYDDVGMNASEAEQPSDEKSTPMVNGDNIRPVESPPTIPSTFGSSGIIPLPNIKKPLNEPLPSPQPGRAQIYTPDTIDKQKFRKENIIEMVDTDKAFPEVKLYRELLNRYLFRAYQGELYIFNNELGIYEKQTDLVLDYLINENFGSVIEKSGGLKLYYEIKEYLKKSSNLVVTEANFQPLQYWGFKNGFYNIYDDVCIVNNGRYFVRNVLQCAYNPNALCPIFDKFIESICGGDLNLINLLWEIIGYLLSNDTNAKVFFVFVGKKDTGKSLLAHVIKNIIGENATSYLSASDFSGRFAVAELKDKKLNVCMDLPNRPFSEETVGIIKAMTGNDVMRSDVKYKESIHFRPTTRLLFGSNFLPNTVSYDSAFLERMIIVPFRFAVPKSKMDYDLERKLMNEKEGICKKAIFYYKQLVSKKYRFTTVELPYEDTSIDDNKVIGYFAEENCEFTGLDSDKIFTTTLYEDYRNYCYAKDITPLKIADFSRKFNEMFSHKTTKKKIKIGNEALNGFIGIRLKKTLPDKLLNI